MYKIKFLIILLSIVSFGQNIEADRPDQTETPSLVPAKMFQFETGLTHQKENKTTTSYLLPTVLSKYGVNDNFELRLITEFLCFENDNTTLSGINPVLIGFKAKLFEENGLIPKIAVIGHLGLPNVSSNRLKLDFLAPEFRFVMQHTLSGKLSFSYNLGGEWDGISPEPTFIYTVATGYTISEKLGSYIEVFGFAPQKSEANHSIDGGFTYLVNSNFMLDASAGFGITENAPKYYTAIGFSFRI